MGEVQGCSRGWQSASFGFISNAHNLPGTPVRNKSLRQCIDVCKANASCKAFSYEKGKSKSNCWLKKALTHSGNKLYSTQRSTPRTPSRSQNTPSSTQSTPHTQSTRKAEAEDGQPERLQVQQEEAICAGCWLQP